MSSLIPYHEINLKFVLEYNCLLAFSSFSWEICHYNYILIIAAARSDYGTRVMALMDPIDYSGR